MNHPRILLATLVVAATYPLSASPPAPAQDRGGILVEARGATLTKLRVVSAIIALWVAMLLPVRAGIDPAPVRVALDITQPGAAISPDFIGLSFEASLLLPNRNGIRYFRPENRALIDLFRTLGIRSLRIGGNTSDRDAKQLPGPADWDSLFAFARQAEVKVIYCLQLCRGDQRVAVDTVSYIMGHYAPLMDSFSIGQEPSAYPVGLVDERPVTERMGPSAEKYTYAAYAREWKQFAEAIVAAVPEVRLSGPGVHNDGRWATQFITDFGRSNNVSTVLMHLYPGGPGTQVPSPELGRQQMLSDKFTAVYQKLHDGFVPLALSNGLPYRLEEVNNYYYGGAADVSSTFASALWGLDFMHWWARHGAAGLNFHTGDQVAAGSTMTPCKYTAFYSVPDGLMVRPLGYGIKAFAVGGKGRMLTATLSNPQKLNLSVYPVLGDDGKVYLTIVNKENGKHAPAASVALDLNGRRFTFAEVMKLESPQNDLAASAGQTLGGAAIKNDAAWAGNWMPLKASREIEKDGLEVVVPPATAWLVRLSQTKPPESPRNESTR